MCSARRSVRGAGAVFVAWIQAAAQWRANMAIWSIASVVQIVVYMSVWRAVARASGGSAGGYTVPEFAGYFLLLLLVRDLTFTWVAWNFPDKVRTGKLSPVLLRPLHPLLGEWGEIAAFRTQGTLLLLPALVALTVVFDAQVDATPAAIAAGVVVVALASVVRFMSDALLALSSFWLVRIDGLRGLYFLALLMLSGQFAPLSLYPDGVQQVAKALPFWWVLGYPVELLAGRQPVSSVPEALLVLGAWCGGLLVAIRIVWARGVRRYGAVGA